MPTLILELPTDVLFLLITHFHSEQLITCCRTTHSLMEKSLKKEQEKQLKSLRVHISICQLTTRENSMTHGALIANIATIRLNGQIQFQKKLDNTTNEEDFSNSIIVYDKPLTGRNRSNVFYILINHAYLIEGPEINNSSWRHAHNIQNFLFLASNIGLQLKKEHKDDIYKIEVTHSKQRRYSGCAVQLQHLVNQLCSLIGNVEAASVKKQSATVSTLEITHPDRSMTSIAIPDTFSNNSPRIIQ